MDYLSVMSRLNWLGFELALAGQLLAFNGWAFARPSERWLGICSPFRAMAGQLLALQSDGWAVARR